jgi:hypothetical protein
MVSYKHFNKLCGGCWMMDVGDGVYWCRLCNNHHQIILDNNQCTILLVLVIPVIQSTHFLLSDTQALKILPATYGLNWSKWSC